MTRLIASVLITTFVFASCGGSDVGTGEAPTTSLQTETTTSTSAVANTATSVPVTTTTEAPISTTEPAKELSEDESAIVEAYSVAFDSESTFEQTSHYLIAPTGLEETVTGYQAIGTQMGGVSVEIETIEIDGDEASITYSLLFGGNPTYTGLGGTATLTSSGWQISREMFCGLMTSARVGCPEA